MFIGVEIGGTKLQVVAGDRQRGIVHRWRGNVDLQGGPNSIRQQIGDAILQVKQKEPSAQAIGVGFGGPVDVRSGRIAKSHQVGGWDDFPMGPWLAELTGLPVTVENDSNTGALGEAIAGAGRGFDPVFYFNLGSGVGGGLIAGGQIYHGASPGEAEFGHLRLNRDGTTVESHCSGWAIDARIRELQSVRPDSVLARLIGNVAGAEAKHLPAALAQNDSAAWAIMRELSDDLAFALSHVVHLFHPQVIVLGGGLSMTGEPLRKPVAEALPQHVMDVFHPVPQVRLAELKEDAVPAGALELAARKAIQPRSGERT